MPIPIFRISLSNATVLSVAYLMVAMVIELSRRLFNFRWTERASWTVDAVPSRTLDWFGAYTPLRQAVIHDQLPTVAMRIALGAVSVASIFAVAMVVGTLMWLARWALTRKKR